MNVEVDVLCSPSLIVSRVSGRKTTLKNGEDYVAFQRITLSPPANRDRLEMAQSPQPTIVFRDSSVSIFPFHFHCVGYHSDVGKKEEGEEEKKKKKGGKKKGWGWRGVCEQAAVPSRSYQTKNKKHQKRS